MVVAEIHFLFRNSYSSVIREEGEGLLVRCTLHIYKIVFLTGWVVESMLSQYWENGLFKGFVRSGE